MEIVLDQYEVKDCIKEEVENPLEDFIKLDKKCKSIIVQCVANSHLEYIKDKKTAYSMWKALENVFQRKGVAGQLYLRKKLLTMKLNRGESLENHFVKFEETVRELKSVGAKLEEADVVCHLLLTLPKTYDGIITALETVESPKLTLEFVKGKLFDQEIKKKSTNLAPAAAFNSSSRFHNSKNSRYRQNIGNKNTKRNIQDMNCNKCGKMGHNYRNCWFNKKEANQANIEEESIAFVATAMSCDAEDTNEAEEDFITWIVDSGATNHMVNCESYFSHVKPLENNINISVAKSDDSIVATKIGNINVLLSNNTFAEIKDVLYIKNLRQNLLSVQKLEKAGLKVVFEDNYVSVFKNTDLLLSGKQVNGLYKVQLKIVNQSTNYCVQNADKNIWHCRLGHISDKNLFSLFNNNMVEGLNIHNVKNTTEICSVCAQSNITRLPFQKVSGKVTKRPLELVHSDICGPISPSTYDSKSYFLTFLDDYTHFSIVYLMRYKSEVFDCFKHYEAFVTNQLDCRIGSFRCDNGKEYCSKDFTSFCKAKGIQIRYTTPYNPEQNGAAERLNRTLLEKARAMLLESKLSKSLWGETILCATYLLNRSPTTSLKENVTPAEMFYGKKPNLKNFRIFGSVVYSHIPKEKQINKINPKGEINIMVGYATSGYRLWDPRKEKVIIARNVIFDESKNISNIVFNTAHTEVSDVKKVSDQVNDGNEELNGQEETVIEDDIEESATYRRSKRERKRPEHLKDFLNDDEIEHMALNATSFVEELPMDLEEIKTRPDSEVWQDAINEEINSLRKNNTWTLVEKPENSKVIGSRWVFRIKRNYLGEPIKHKARLVAKGFMQREGFDFNETYAPVARLTTVGTLLAVSNFKNLKIQQMDVKSAFLHGKVDEDIYMRIPEGFKDDKSKVCKLNKALYGLKQSPYCWNKRFDEFAEKEKLLKSKDDPCLYIKSNKEDVVCLLLYVDDILIASNDKNKIQTLKLKLQEEFEMQDLGDLKIFLGINVRQNKEGIYLSQANYIQDLLKRFRMSDCKAIRTPMEKDVNLSESETSLAEMEHKPIRELIGCLMYLMLATRPDLSFSVNLCSRYQQAPTEQLWKSLKRILRYLQGTKNFELHYPKDAESVLIGFADADWAGDQQDRKSTTGYLFKVFGGTVCWSIKKQSTVAMSSTEAEYVALAEAAREGIWLSNLLKDLGLAKTVFTIFEDNQSCIKLTKRWEHKRLKHIDVKFNFIRDVVREGLIVIKYICTSDQTADILTKNVVGELLVRHRLNLGLLSTEKSFD